jgi:hypothetical protein
VGASPTRQPLQPDAREGQAGRFGDGAEKLSMSALRNYRTSADGLANGRVRPFAALQDRPYERAGRARKRPSAECVGCTTNKRFALRFSFDLWYQTAVASCRESRSFEAIFPWPGDDIGT